MSARISRARPPPRAPAGSAWKKPIKQPGPQAAQHPVVKTRIQEQPPKGHRKPSAPPPREAGETSPHLRDQASAREGRREPSVCGPRTGSGRMALAAGTRISRSVIRAEPTTTLFQSADRNPGGSITRFVGFERRLVRNEAGVANLGRRLERSRHGDQEREPSVQSTRACERQRDRGLAQRSAPEGPAGGCGVARLAAGTMIRVLTAIVISSRTCAEATQ